MSGRSYGFLGFYQYFGSQCVLLKDTTQCQQWDSNPGGIQTQDLSIPTFNSKSDVLPLSHHAPLEKNWIKSHKFSLSAKSNYFCLVPSSKYVKLHNEMVAITRMYQTSLHAFLFSDLQLSLRYWFVCFGQNLTSKSTFFQLRNLRQHTSTTY